MWPQDCSPNPQAPSALKESEDDYQFIPLVCKGISVFHIRITNSVQQFLAEMLRRLALSYVDSPKNRIKTRMYFEKATESELNWTFSENSQDKEAGSSSGGQSAVLGLPQVKQHVEEPAPRRWAANPPAGSLDLGTFHPSPCSPSISDEGTSPICQALTVPTSLTTEMPGPHVGVCIPACLTDFSI